MGTINTNKSAAKHCVIFCKHQDETPLDVCRNFRNWTIKNGLKSYVEIAEMLDIAPNEVKKYLDLAKMPEYDSTVLKRMKEVMAQNRF
ncbi:hypothetical protein [Streptococcus gallolyticus]|uniref:hypothetical protein n=1 Tax=Streptococcus gallolyticus TaxID=315405 RepID=UPI0022834CCF|nr:hypothetical protein [Streptococcus gallolyticus]MCY7186380.1 hypothetical protein [Streptococcus gallolyticus subsp. gallolyticus]MCY7190271.1 hypothetical protein [Streptococcus gallolyticus subsp. gallolyticus]